VRLREKGGKRHEMPCHHTIEDYLYAYLDGTGIAGDPKGPLFRTIGRGTGRLSRAPLPQANAHAMVRRRAAAAGIATRIGNHSFRATGIIAYLKKGGEPAIRHQDGANPDRGLAYELPRRPGTGQQLHDQAEIVTSDVDQIALVQVLPTAQPSPARATAVEDQREAPLDDFGAPEILTVDVGTFCFSMPDLQPLSPKVPSWSGHSFRRQAPPIVTE
jgi:hypothetical protein